MNLEELTPKKFWDKRHQLEQLKTIYPKPNKYYLDFALDLMFQKYLSKMKNKKILEIGCGSSLWLPYFYKKFGLDITGIDYSEKGIEMSREILKRNKVKGCLLRVNFLEIDKKYKFTFDVVFSLGLLEHFNNPILVLKNIKDFLMPNGLLITWVPNTSGLILSLSQRLNKHLENIYYKMNLKRLIEVHKLSEFEVLEGYYTQFMDLILISFFQLPSFWQRWSARFFRVIGLPFILLEKYLKIHIRNRKLCSGIIIVAKKQERV